MIYVISSFAIDSTIENNPPLSAMGITQAKTIRSKLVNFSFDYCFASPLVADYGSAMIMLGDKMIIDRDKRLELINSPEIVQKNIEEFINYLKNNYIDKNILIVAKKEMINILKKINSSIKEIK